MITLATQFAEGLSYAHEQGVIHRDVKPGNVLVAQNGTAKVSDFGLAKARPVRSVQDGIYQYAIAGNGIMSIAYCSPEQHKGEKLTTRTDSWSWGLSCLEMFNGGVTWEIGIVAQAALERYEKAGARDSAIPKMPKPFVDLLRACFARDPQSRPGMKDIVATLTTLQRGESGNWFTRLFS